ncbi:MAG: hypothetical protein HKL91_00765 [Candidatus Eremiobacteraeota bacterium]|uniref:Uncharacterized protein n=1 Tax=mine drainage metagenome TaxID=410659 RepID=E6PC76_9ZZZZ|nr:hypothetical protein [Candidatus Eremiobacteraeota bacterium]
MPRHTNASLAALCAAISLAIPTSATAATPAPPSIARVDAVARARGNRRALAVAIGERLFTHVLPVQLLEIRASGLGNRAYVGLRFSGEKFHGSVSKAELDRELADAVETAFAVSQQIREVDCWIVVPIPVAPGTVVSGDKAMPTERDVFTLSVRRGESAAHLARRLKGGEGIVVDPEWIAHALAKGVPHA